MDEAASQLGIRIIAPDRPGIGGSDFHPGRRLLDWPPVLLEMAAQLGFEKFHVFGVSGGGPYVLAAAHAIPERLLSASTVCGAPPLKLFGTRDLFWPYRAVLMVRRHLSFLLTPVFKLFALISRRKPAQAPMRWLLGMLKAEDRRVMKDERNLHVITEAFRQSIAQSVAHVQADADIYLGDFGFDIREITFPVHVWHGREDLNIPFSYAVKLAALLPNAITHWRERDGHYSLPITCGREVAEVGRSAQCSVLSD